MGTTAAILLVAMLPMQAQQDRLSAQDAIKLAWNDMGQIPPELRSNYRYLALQNLDPKQRAYFRPIISGHCNKLGRLSVIEPARLVGRGELLRIDLTHYGWPADLWEKLEDPYFTEPSDNYYEQEYGYTDQRTGKWVRTRVEKVKTGRISASWLDKKMMSDLYTWSGSYWPVSQADWFFNQSAASQDRKVAYHDWLGFKDLKTYDQLVGVDETRSRNFRFELREATGISGVATHLVRVIIRDDALGGARWKTLDFDNAKDAYDALNILGRDIDKSNWKATETFGILPNGLWAVGAFGRDGKLARFVPGEVANDNASRSNDKRIHNGVSCFRCHSNGGLQDVDEWARSLLNPPLKLNTPDYKKYVELREQYLRSLTAAIKRDRATYEDAIKEATGLESKEDSKRYAEFWELYEDARVGADKAARDMGIETKELRERLLAYVKENEAEYYTTRLNLVAAAFIPEGPKAKTIPVHQYEEVIPILYRAAYKKQPN